VVASFTTVGTLLVSGLLIAPPATAALLARRVWAVMLGAVGFGVTSIVVGLELSYHYDLAAGASAAAVAVGAFFVTAIAVAIRDAWARRPARAGGELSPS
jgi:ABC-type Mn2+/Zn2+ transport system permease subunit